MRGCFQGVQRSPSLIHVAAPRALFSFHVFKTPQFFVWSLQYILLWHTFCAEFLQEIYNFTQLDSWGMWKTSLMKQVAEALQQHREHKVVTCTTSTLAAEGYSGEQVNEPHLEESNLLTSPWQPPLQIIGTARWILMREHLNTLTCIYIDDCTDIFLHVGGHTQTRATILAHKHKYNATDYTFSASEFGPLVHKDLLHVYCMSIRLL